MSLYLGLLIFSFVLTSIVIVPFINILYKLKFTRRKEAPKTGKVPLFDKMHDSKAGTPIGGGILVIFMVSLLFAALFPPISYMGVFISAAYNVQEEIKVIFFTFLAFGFLGLLDDFIKMFGKMEAGSMGMWVGLKRKQKFALQWVIAIMASFMLYNNLDIHIVHIPVIERVLDLGIFYIPFAAFTIVSFANAYNITDGLDGLAPGLLVICLFALWMIAAASLDTPLSVFIALWIGSLMAFLYFNVFPARIFMGDAGALAFGATLAVVGLLTGKIFAVLVIGGIFVVEAVSSLVQIFGWRVLKRPIFPIAPAHLLFQVRKWEESKIVTRAWLAGIMLAIFGLWLAII
jgi:phospho-N-acetylmuramoyl-pentapeptide-transferase